MDSEGIYSNLFEYDLGAEVHRLQEENEKLSTTTTSLQADVEKLCCKITEMKKIQDNLSRNISELYKTAKSELERKDRIIADLRRDVDNYAFRRNKRFQTDNRPPKLHERNILPSIIKQEIGIKDNQVGLTTQETRETRHNRLEKDAKNMKFHLQNYTSVLDDVDLYVSDNTRRYQLSNQKESTEKREATPLEPVKKKIKYDDYKRTRLDKPNSDCERSAVNTSNTFGNRRDRGKFDHQRYNDDRRSNDRRYDDNRRYRDNRRYDVRYTDDRRYSDEWRYDQTGYSDDPRVLDEHMFNDRKPSRSKEQHKFSGVNVPVENPPHKERLSDNPESKYNKCTKSSSKKALSRSYETTVEKSQNTVLKNLLEIEKKTVLITDPKQSPLHEINQEKFDKPEVGTPTKEDGEISDDSSRNVEKSHVERDGHHKKETPKSTHKEENITMNLNQNLTENYQSNERKISADKEKPRSITQKENIRITDKSPTKMDVHTKEVISESYKLKKSKKIHHRRSSENNRVDNFRATEKINSHKNDKKKSSRRKDSNENSEKHLNDKPNSSAYNGSKKAEDENLVNITESVQSTKEFLNSLPEENKEKKNKLPVHVDDANTKIFSLSDTSLLSATENYHLSEIASKSEIPTLNIDDIVANTSYLASSVSTEQHSTVTKITSRTDNLHLFNQNSNSNKQGSFVSVPCVEATAYVQNIVTESNDTGAVQISIPDANVADLPDSGLKTVKPSVEKMVLINIPEKHIRTPRVSSIFSPLKPLERNVQQEVILKTNFSKSFGDSSTSIINSSPSIINNSQITPPSSRRKRRRCVMTIEDK